MEDPGWTALAQDVLKAIKVLEPKGHFPKPHLTQKPQKKITLVVDDDINPNRLTTKSLIYRLFLKHRSFI